MSNEFLPYLLVTALQINAGLRLSYFKHSTESSSILNSLYIPRRIIKMDTSMSMPAMDDSSSALNASGVHFSNDTQAMDFLGDILDDSDLQTSGIAFARYFWYGVVVVIGITAIFNIIQTITLRLRYAYLLLSGTCIKANDLSESALPLLPT